MICSDTSLCLEKGCEKVCVEAPALCDLHNASNTGDLSRVIFVLSQGQADINCQEWIGRTPVMWAARGGHKKVVESLVSNGAKLSRVDKFGINILHSASLGGDVEVVKYVLSSLTVGINDRGPCARTAVMLAAENGQKDALELLVGRGADVSLVDRKGENILHCACRGGDAEVVEYILSKKSVDINSRGHRKKTPMMVAGQNGHQEVVELLINHGAKLLLRDKVGDNVLHLACSKGHLDVVKYIISLHKMNINSGGFEKKTPVMLAGYGGHKEVVELLVKNGADLARRDSDYNTILHLISYGGSVDVLKYVLSFNSVYVNSRGWKKRTPVMIAGQKGYTELVEIFVQHGADLTLTDRVGDNILLLSMKHMEVLKYVLSLGTVNINAKNKRGQSAAMRARSRGKRDVLDLLVSQGAHI